LRFKNLKKKILKKKTFCFLTNFQKLCFCKGNRNIVQFRKTERVVQERKLDKSSLDKFVHFQQKTGRTEFDGLTCNAKETISFKKSACFVKK
jgi:hypothetical protein